MKYIVSISLYIWALTSAMGQSAPLTPLALKAVFIEKSGKSFVKLSWRPHPEDTLVNGYYIFNNFPPDQSLLLNGQINRIQDTTYLYEVKNLYGANYKFAIKSVAEFPNKLQSEMTEPVSVLVPSKKLPIVKIKTVSELSGKISIEWIYREIADLKGFRVYINGNSINGQLLKGNSGQFDIPDSLSGKLFIQMTAMSMSGLESSKSAPKSIYLNK